VRHAGHGKDTSKSTIPQLGLWSVRFSSVFTKTDTEPKLLVSVSVFTKKNRFSINQNRYQSVITENWTDLLTHSSGIYHAEELFLQKEKKRTLVTFLYWKTIKKKSLSTLPPGAMPKGAILFLKKKKQGMER
jgi:hypothetical protein